MRATQRLLGILPKSSYYDRDYRQAAALIRARQPYLIKNIITGLCLTTITISIYAFTFYAVKQDDFSDVPMPPAPAGSAPQASPNKHPGIASTTS